MGKMDMDTPENGGAFGHRGAIELPPCLFLRERRLSEAKTERENREKALSVTFGDSAPSVTALPKGEPRGVPCFIFLRLPGGLPIP